LADGTSRCNIAGLADGTSRPDTARRFVVVGLAASRRSLRAQSHSEKTLAPNGEAKARNRRGDRPAAHNYARRWREVA
jgi:hypothetical protein